MPNRPKWERRGEYGLEIWEYQEPEPEVEGDEADDDDSSGWLSVCTVHQPGDANARLIVSAPKLKEALKEIGDNLDGDVINKGNWSRQVNLCHDIIDSAFATIAEVKGE